MPIKLNVPFSQKAMAKELGAWWFSDDKTWVIPDTTEDINPFMKWLPEDEGFIVKRPYILAKAERYCWKCRKETPLIALGAKCFYALEYETINTPKWTKWEYPILFSDIDVLESETVDAIQKDYPFFQKAYSKTAKTEYWGNTCVHCNSLQGDNYLFMNANAPFSPITREDARNIKKAYLRLRFDYYLRAGYNQNEMYGDVF